MAVNDKRAWTDKPTIPGWYWFRRESGYNTKIVWVSGRRFAVEPYHEPRPVEDMAGQWYGPLEQPE